MGSPIAIVVIINPSCLRVDKAIIFLKSNSKFAVKPDIIIVNLPVIINNWFNKLFENRWLNRIIKYTPAVTRVEEWTRADTGVGAAMAAGSQAENGIWALLVNPAVIINKLIVVINILFWLYINKKFHDPILNIHVIAIIIATSPIRFDRAVSIPALNDLLFW